MGKWDRGMEGGGRKEGGGGEEGWLFPREGTERKGTGANGQGGWIPGGERGGRRERDGQRCTPNDRTPYRKGPRAVAPGGGRGGRGCAHGGASPPPPPRGWVEASASPQRRQGARGTHAATAAGRGVWVSVWANCSGGGWRRRREVQRGGREGGEEGDDPMTLPVCRAWPHPLGHTQPNALDHPLVTAGPRLPAGGGGYGTPPPPPRVPSPQRRRV